MMRSKTDCRPMKTLGQNSARNTVEKKKKHYN